MDMLNILKNMDAAAAGKKPSAGAEAVNDMKAILESIQSVQECGEMAPQGMPEPDKVTMNVSLNARGTDAIADLIKLMGGKGESEEHEEPMQLPVPKHDADDMARMIAMASGEHGDDEGEEESMEEWDNTPEEEYGDTKLMTKDLSGGLNREKKMYAKAQDGDNPMAVESSLKESLSAQLRAKMDELSKK